MTNKDQKIDELLKRGVDEVINLSVLKRQLEEGEPLRIKLGIDPTSPNLHLGRAVPLLKLRDFQELGHKIVFIVGDFTGQIGDTSDKDSERPMLTESEVKKNMVEYAKQAGKILDIKKVEVKYNSGWLSKLTYSEIGKQADTFSLAEFIDRENIKKRLNAGKRVSLREVLYPLMQGYDSVAVRADVEIGGTDQRFNLLAGRKLQPAYNQTPQNILMTNLILGTDGRKMSSSWGNTINLTDEAGDMYGKVMSIPDELIINYFIHCTRVSMAMVENYQKDLQNGKNPRDIKMVLAYEIVKIYHGDSAAKQAELEFVKIFQQKDLPADIAEYKIVGLNIVEALVKSKLAASKTEARRFVEQKSIKINDKVVEDLEFKVKSADILQRGKRFFAKAI